MSTLLVITYDISYETNTKRTFVLLYIAGTFSLPISTIEHDSYTRSADVKASIEVIYLSFVCSEKPLHLPLGS